MNAVCAALAFLFAYLALAQPVETHIEYAIVAGSGR